MGDFHFFAKPENIICQKGEMGVYLRSNTIGTRFDQKPDCRASHQVRRGRNMIRLVNGIFFMGCALAVARYYGLGSTVQLLAALAIALGLMRLLSGRRVH